MKIKQGIEVKNDGFKELENNWKKLSIPISSPYCSKKMKQLGPNYAPGSVLIPQNHCDFILSRGVVEGQLTPQVMVQQSFGHSRR